MRTARFKKCAQIHSREGSAQKRATVFHEIYLSGVLIIPNRFKQFLRRVADINCYSALWFLFNCRINLSPFTKDFRGEEHSNESKIIFSSALSQDWGHQ